MFSNSLLSVALIVHAAWSPDHRAERRRHRARQHGARPCIASAARELRLILEAHYLHRDPAIALAAITKLETAFVRVAVA